MSKEGIISISELAAIAQQERIVRAQKPLGFVDRMHPVLAETIANDVLVETMIISGAAKLDQEWNFDSDGNLRMVQIVKKLKTKEGFENVGYLRLERDESGQFRQIKQGFMRVTTDKLRRWEKEFGTADRRMKKRG